MLRGSRALLVAVCLLAFGMMTAPASVAETRVDTSGSAFAQSDVVDDSETTFLVALDSGGDAEIRIVERRNLTTAAELDAWNDTSAAFEEGSLTLGAAAFVAAADAVDERTDRAMDTSPVERTATIENESNTTTGVLRAEFEWENFARVDENRLHVDDVFLTENGLWLPGLTADQTLVVRSPAGYGVASATVPPDGDGDLQWTGPTAFDEGMLYATFVGDNGNNSNGNGTNGNDSNDNDTNDTQNNTSTPSGDDDQSILLWLLVGAILVVVVALAAHPKSRERLRLLVDGPPDAATGGTDDSGDGPDEAGAGGPDDGSDGPDGPGPAGASDTDVADATRGTAATATESDEMDEELLSDEERVERLLERNGGRMKQATIVEKTDWSNAKVSQLLSSMEEEDRIDKLRIGRENLISFPDVEVTELDTGE